MPEGPELHLASLYVNKMCEGVVFSGPVVKSEVSKSPDVSFNCESYRITASSRGKEVKLTLTPIKSDDDGKRRSKVTQTDQPMDIVFRFGMSGYFRFTSEDEVPKHGHLRFYTKEKPCRVLSFVDARRFGSWQPNGTWQPDRGPCIMFEYKSFRSVIGLQLTIILKIDESRRFFPFCLRLNIPPFLCARDALEGLEAKMKGKTQGMGDLLRLCHTVPLEVVSLGGKGYDPEKVDYSAFQAWLQCYYVDGMKSVRDHNGRTMWFKGDPGPMAPKGKKTRESTRERKSSSAQPPGGKHLRKYQLI
uniref:Nei-like DNA glycosylase 1 n=1 Tax=Cyprinodon variegatus TaxID=28743 RepID=A0A3Q2E9G0_CYPVA